MMHAATGCGRNLISATVKSALSPSRVLGIEASESQVSLLPSPSSSVVSKKNWSWNHEH